MSRNLNSAFASGQARREPNGAIELPVEGLGDLVAFFVLVKRSAVQILEF